MKHIYIQSDDVYSTCTSQVGTAVLLAEDDEKEIEIYGKSNADFLVDVSVFKNCNYDEPIEVVTVIDDYEASAEAEWDYGFYLSADYDDDVEYNDDIFVEQNENDLDDIIAQLMNSIFPVYHKAFQDMDRFKEHVLAMIASEYGKEIYRPTPMKTSDGKIQIVDYPYMNEDFADMVNDEFGLFIH